jgi:rhomboid family GlyGly-CTERM serine protease
MANFCTINTSVRTLLSENSTAVWLVCLSLITLLASWAPIVEVGSYQAEATAGGQWWRPFSAWICQLNFNHWAINQWGLVVMLFFLPKRLPLIVLLALAWVWLASSVMLLGSSYDAYVGLSGLLYGWLVISAYYSPYYSGRLKAVFIAALAFKVFLENGIFFGFVWESQMLESVLRAPVAHLSHLWGLSSGLVFLSLALFRARFKFWLPVR